MGTSDVKRLHQILFAAAATFLTLGCMVVQKQFTEISKNGGSNLKASGPQVKETRSLHDFERIDAGGIFQVDVTLGNTPSVVLEAPKNLLHHITTTVSGSTLTLSVDTGFSMSHGEQIRAHVVARHLTAASISGAGQMIINGKVRQGSFEAHAGGAATLKFSADVSSLKLEASGGSKTSITGLGAKSADIETSGAANCTIDGTVQSATITSSGASQIKGSFTAGEAKVETSGAAHLNIHVINSLTGEASGASSIQYSGHPSKLTTQTSGVGHIGKI